MTRAALFLGLAALATACVEEEPRAGESGGLCRLGTSPCNEGLVCLQGGCMPIGAVEQDAQPPLEVTFNLEKRSLIADGEDSLIARFEVFERESGEPWVGEVRTWVDPPNAGMVGPARIELEDGKAVTRLIACKTGRDGCPPATAVFKVATLEDPLDAVGQSEPITMRGDGSPPPGGGGGGPGGGPIGGPGGGPTGGDPAVPPAQARTRCSGANGAVAFLSAGNRSYTYDDTELTVSPGSLQLVADGKARLSMSFRDEGTWGDVPPGTHPFQSTTDYEMDMASVLSISVRSPEQGVTCAVNRAVTYTGSAEVLALEDGPNNPNSGPDILSLTFEGQCTGDDGTFAAAGCINYDAPER